jgi:hypothetical protein
MQALLPIWIGFWQCKPKLNKYKFLTLAFLQRSVRVPRLHIWFSAYVQSYQKAVLKGVPEPAEGRGFKLKFSIKTAR